MWTIIAGMPLLVAVETRSFPVVKGAGSGSPRAQAVVLVLSCGRHYITRARRDAKREGLEISFFQGDMRRIDYREDFDGVFNWFGGFGYLSEAENLDVAQLMHQALKPGGRLLIEGINKSWLLTHSHPLMDQVAGGVHVEMRSRFDTRTQRLISTWMFRRGRHTERRRLSIRIYNGSEIRALLRAAGLREIQLFGNPPLGRFTRHSRRFIAVARRPIQRR